VRLLVRIFAATSVVTIIVMGGFAYLEVRDERARLEQDLQRRAALVAEAVREAAEPLMARGAKGGFERVLKRFGGSDRAIAIYDQFGSLIDASLDIKPYLGPLSPFVTDAIRDNVPQRRATRVAGGTVWMHITPLQRDDRAIGAIAVLIDAD
jgi:hypothetical protein